jgi:VWFA-related protein
MRAAWLGGCLLVVLAGGLRAQQTSAPTPQGQQPVFRGGVDLVTLDVRVVDKDGKPVPGLTASDFVVTLDGQPRPVRALDFMTFGSAKETDVAAPSAPKGNGSAAPTPSAPRGGRVILFDVDDVSARPLEIVALVAAAQRMLPTFDPADLVGLVTTSGLGGFVPPTRDRAAVNAALHSRNLIGRVNVRDHPFVSVNEAIEIARYPDGPVYRAVVERECGQQTSRTADQRCPLMVLSQSRMIDAMTNNQRNQQLEGYAHAISALHAEPAPRVLIAITKGFPLSPYIPSPLDAVSQAAATADVGFYALVPEDEGGVDLSDTGQGSQDRARARVEESRFLVDGTHALAIAAGGEAFGVIGQADRFLHRIDTETSALYRLGIETPPGTAPNRFLAVKVSVNRPGVSVRTNLHALKRPVDAPEAASGTAVSTAAVDPMRQRLDQGGDSSGVPMRLATAFRKDPASAHAQMLITVDVPAATPGPLKALFAVLNGSGAIVQSGRADVPPTPNDDYHLTMPVPIDEGEYRVRVVASDANGNLGSIDRPTPVHLRHIGPFVASDLLLSASLGDAEPHLLTLDTVPPNATKLQASLELYATDPPPPALSVHMSITPELGGAPIAEVDLAPALRNGALVVSSTMSVEDLNAGRYVFTATVTSAGQTVGTVTAKVRRDR